MPQVTWTHPWLHLVLNEIPPGTASVVDVGCGRGIVGALCRIYREPPALVGVDGHRPYLDFCERRRFYDRCVQAALGTEPLPFNDQEFEVATCIEVIEHLTKPNGGALLDELERIAKRVVVTTPNYMFDQAEYDANPYQAHLSLWQTDDFRRRGYQVRGVGGLKVLGRSVRYVSQAFGALTKNLPQLSTTILCVRDSSTSTTPAR